MTPNIGLHARIMRVIRSSVLYENGSEGQGSMQWRKHTCSVSRTRRRTLLFSDVIEANVKRHLQQSVVDQI